MRYKNQYRLVSHLLVILLLLSFLMVPAYSQKPYRVGTTSASFLEIGVGSDGNAMGDAFVSIPGKLSSIYWNPAGLAFLNHNEVLFMYQPWLIDINTTSAAAALNLPRIGIIAAGIAHVGYGEEEVTTMEYQDGTGEIYTANDYCFTLSYSRKLAQWFAFGASLKYINSQIWHTSASAVATDLGVIVSTGFFAPSKRHEAGLRIGMSIANYGTKMRYDGMDLLFPIDILPDEDGNYSAVQGQFKPQGWELPLIFRIGASLSPITSRFGRLTLAADAIHPNNNAESVNLGAELELNLPGMGKLAFRTGYKSLFMPDSEFGMTYGGGLQLNLMQNVAVKVDYAFKPIGLLGNTHSYTVGVQF